MEMTITPISPTRARLRSTRKPAPPAAIPRPYRHLWVAAGEPHAWTLVVRVRATGQQLRSTHYSTTQPSEADGARVASRLYRDYAKGAGR